MTFLSKKNKARYYIGLDVGVKTGLCVWDSQEKRILSIETYGILEAMEAVGVFLCTDGIDREDVILVIEDPNQRKWFGTSGREVLQGAGSVKRDFSIWTEFCKVHKLNYWAKPPRKAQKMKEIEFKFLTKVKGRTSQHARDACLLVFGL